MRGRRRGVQHIQKLFFYQSGISFIFDKRIKK